MNSVTKSILQKAMAKAPEGSKTEAAIDVMFTKLIAVPLQRAWRERRPTSRWAGREPWMGWDRREWEGAACGKEIEREEKQRRAAAEREEKQRWAAAEQEEREWDFRQRAEARTLAAEDAAWMKEQCEPWDDKFTWIPSMEVYVAKEDLANLQETWDKRQEEWDDGQLERGEGLRRRCKSRD
jgi:hypothetical protein